MTEETNYQKYRGKCKEFAKELAESSNGELEIVRGYYYEPLWNRDEPHWWCKDKNGVIHDPTKLQFPSGGMTEFYREFDGYLNCEQCGKQITESEIVPIGNYATCSKRCAMSLVGL